MEQNNKTKIFEEYSIPKAFISLAIPTIISQIIMIIYWALEQELIKVRKHFLKEIKTKCLLQLKKKL